VVGVKRIYLEGERVVLEGTLLEDEMRRSPDQLKRAAGEIIRGWLDGNLEGEGRKLPKGRTPSVIQIESRNGGQIKFTAMTHTPKRDSVGQPGRYFSDAKRIV
jgi:hypothetical protein